MFVFVEVAAASLDPIYIQRFAPGAAQTIDASKCLGEQPAPPPATA